ncbi:MAG: bifunctional nicotinamidase/pyrazinamidase [Promethearchaeota archaeon]
MDISDVQREKSVMARNGDALIVIDMQYDFLPGGALPVDQGDTIIPGINELIDLFHNKNLPVIFTQDWHPENHASFASRHGKQPYDPVDDPAGLIGPVLWPDHCIQGERGAMLHDDLHVDKGIAIIRKGYHRAIDSYSAFLENDKITKTGLKGFLEGIGVRRVFVCGLALDYCVYNTAIDARMLGFEVMFVLDLAMAVGTPEGILSESLSTMITRRILFTNRSHVK